MKLFLRIVYVLIIFTSLCVLGYRAAYDFHLIRSGETFFVQKSTPDGYDYLLRIPRGYNDYSGKQPLLIFLHGAGEVNASPQRLRQLDPYFYSRKTYKNSETAEFPFIGVTPICDQKKWEPYRVIATLDQVLKEKRFQVDRTRIYLTGYSMGGFGTFETAMEYPNRFTAFVPVAGGGEPAWADKLKAVPIWVFHGEADKTVPLPSSALLADALKKKNAPNIKLTAIKGAGHGIAADVYARRELYQFLLQYRLLIDDPRSDAGDFVNRGLSR